MTYQVVVNYSNSASAGNYQFSVTGGAGNNGQPVLFNGLPVIGATVTIALPTATPSFTPVFTSTFTATFTLTPTFTPNFTATATATTTPQAVSTPAIFPNPSNGTQPVTLAVTVNQPSDSLTVQVFTVAFRKVQDNVVYPGPQDSTATGTSAKTWYVHMSMDDKWGMPLASGLYYVVISNHNGYHAVTKLLILR